MGNECSVQSLLIWFPNSPPKGPATGGPAGSDKSPQSPVSSVGPQSATNGWIEISCPVVVYVTVVRTRVAVEGAVATAPKSNDKCARNKVTPSAPISILVERKSPIHTVTGGHT